MKAIHFLLALFSLVLLSSCAKSDDPANLIDPPVAAFTDSVVGTLPILVNFTNTSTGPAGSSYNWNFGDGSSVTTLANPSHYYTAAGNYNVRLIQTSPLGVSDTVTQQVMISISGRGSGTSGTTGASFVFSVPSAVPYTIYLRNASTSATSYLWNFGDGSTSTTASPTLSHVYNSGGTYTIQLKVTGPGGVDSVARTYVLR